MKLITAALIAGRILVLTALSGLPLNAQTYSVEYKCRAWASANVPGSSDDGGDSTNKATDNSLSLVPFSISTVYRIVSDGKFMIVRASLDSAVMKNPGINVNVTDEDDEVIIDIKQKLIFFPSARVVRKLKLYSLGETVAESGDCMEKNIVEKGSLYRITLCKTLPGEITPPFLFRGNQLGIRSISTPTQFIELRSFIKVDPDKRLAECPVIFQKHPVSEGEEAFFD